MNHCYEVIDYAVDTSSNLVLYHFFIDEENKQIKARSAAIADPQGDFLIPVHDSLYLISIPDEVKKVRMSLVMEDYRDQFLVFKILAIYDKDEDS